MQHAGMSKVAKRKERLLNSLLSLPEIHINTYIINTSSAHHLITAALKSTNVVYGQSKEGQQVSR